MHKGGLVKIMLYLKNNNLSKSLSKTIKLLKFLKTLPMCSIEAEKTFFIFVENKKVFAKHHGHMRLNSLSVILLV